MQRYKPGNVCCPNTAVVAVAPGAGAPTSANTWSQVATVECANKLKLQKEKVSLGSEFHNILEEMQNRASVYVTWHSQTNCNCIWKQIFCWRAFTAQRIHRSTHLHKLQVPVSTHKLIKKPGTQYSNCPVVAELTGTTQHPSYRHDQYKTHTKSTNFPAELDSKANIFTLITFYKLLCLWVRCTMSPPYW